MKTQLIISFSSMTFLLVTIAAGVNAQSYKNDIPQEKESLDRLQLLNQKGKLELLAKKYSNPPETHISPDNFLKQKHAGERQFLTDNMPVGIPGNKNPDNMPIFRRNYDSSGIVDNMPNLLGKGNPDNKIKLIPSPALKDKSQPGK